MATLDYHNKKQVAPFFEDAINEVFLHPEKQMYIMDGAIATGKTSNFLVAGSYALTQCVLPVRQGGRMVREALWAAVRESENSTVATLFGILQDSLFTPEIITSVNSPVKIIGSHPTIIRIEHDLADGTLLRMDIECHGFNNKKAEGRLRSREFMGGLIPEIQTIPWEIAEVLRQRTGRWRTRNTRLEKTINGRKYMLSGAQHLKILLADANIPPRPHPMYDKLYDPPTLEGSPYHIIRPPSPIIPTPIAKVSKAVLDKYPTTRFEKKDVVWLPNPEAYYMTKHFEVDEVDEITGERTLLDDGSFKTKAWSGYGYWYAELKQSDSILRRHIIGIPDTVGGESACYPNFSKTEATKKRTFLKTGTVYVGFDPGKYASFVFFQVYPNNQIHIFHEINFEPADHAGTRTQIKDFVAPYIKNTLKGMEVEIIPDPAAWNSTASGEAPVSILNEFKLKVVHCGVPNQDTASRMDNLGYFIDSGLLSVDPSCTDITYALQGGYQFKTTKGGIISDSIDKDNPWSHKAESAQYVGVRLYRILILTKRRGKSKTGMIKVRKK